MTRRPMLRVAAEALAVLAAGLVGWVALGTAGLAAGTFAAYALVLLLLRLDVEPAPSTPSPPSSTPQDDADFPRYRAIASAVGWSTHSPRHFDRTLRPLLQEVAAARLADRHGVDLVASPERARQLLGPLVWPLVDPARPASEDSHSRGVSLEVLSAALARLEAL